MPAITTTTPSSSPTSSPTSSPASSPPPPLTSYSVYHDHTSANNPASQDVDSSREPTLNVLLTTTTGRYIFHDGSQSAASLLTTLSAALSAFTHTTNAQVSSIHTSTGTLHITRTRTLLLATHHATSPPPNLPHLFLSAVYTAASHSLEAHLLEHPTASAGSVVELVHPLLARLHARLRGCSLPAWLGLFPGLSTLRNPCARNTLQDAFRYAVSKVRTVTHAILLTEGEGAWDQVVVAAARDGLSLSWLDFAILSCAGDGNENGEAERKLFLPAGGFRKGLHVRQRRLCFLADQFCDLERMETGDPVQECTFRLLVLGTWPPHDSTAADSLLKILQVFLMRPGVLHDIGTTQSCPLHPCEILGLQITPIAVLLLGRVRYYMSGYEELAITEAVGKAVSLARAGSGLVAYASANVRVFVQDARYVVVFSADVPLHAAERAVVQVVFPWMKQFEKSLLPVDTDAYVPPNTPLAGFLAPFRG